MRGQVEKQQALFTTISPEARVPQDHPARRIKRFADEVLAEMQSELDALYSTIGRPSIPPEMLLKSTLLMALFSVRSERQFCEQLDYNILYRWFLDMSLEQDSFDHSVFTKNRQRMMQAEVGRQFLALVVENARRKHLLSNDHFSVDGTLIEAWASIKTFKRKDGQQPPAPPASEPGAPKVNFKGEKLSNKTHASTTDPEAMLAKKGKYSPAKLSYTGHALMENRNGLCVDFMVTQATGTAECEAAVALIERQIKKGKRPKTLGADKAYDVSHFIRRTRALGTTVHAAQNSHKGHGSNLDARTTRHPGYSISLTCRKRIEQIFGWLKVKGGLHKVRYKGRQRVEFYAAMAVAAYNLLRIGKLSEEPC